MTKKTFRIIFLSLLLGTLCLVFLSVKISRATTYTQPQVSFSDKLWGYINEWRTNTDREPYVEDNELCRIADIRIKQIQTDFSHDLFNSEYKDYPSKISENISQLFKGGPSEVLSGWLNSPPHKWALEHNYKFSCVRCENNYCVQIFSNLERY